MTQTVKRLDYSTKMVRDLLEGYDYLVEGKMPAKKNDGEIPTGIQHHAASVAPYARPKELKADLDRTLQKLKPMQLCVIIALTINGHDPRDCCQWLGKDVREIFSIEDFSIRRIKRLLNGEQE